jgi:D-3-phosphoglycerate dehydrogenase
MLTVLATDGLSAVGLDVLKKAPGVAAEIRPTMDVETLKKEIANYQAIIVRSATKIRREILDAAPNLELIVRAGIGVDNIDVEYATARGVLVANTPQGNATTTAEHAFALITALARHVPQACRALKGGTWEPKRYMGTELRGKTLGIVGLGNIGRIVARLAQGYQMAVIAHDPYLTPELAKRSGVVAVTLPELLAQSDVVTLHCPLNDATRGMIGKAELAQMKRAAFLVNCARGGIVDEAALAVACSEGVIRGAAVDVYSKEPPPSDHVLLGIDNVIVTPHLGASTSEAQENVSIEAAELVLEYAKNGTVSSAINSEIRLGNVTESTKATVALAKKLGSLQAQLLDGEPKRFSVEIFGDGHGEDSRLITLSAAQPFLQSLFTMDRVNPVNVTQFAKRREVEIVGSIVAAPGPESGGYTNWVRVTVTTKGPGGSEGSHTVRGSVFGADAHRLTEIDGYELDLVAEGTVLLMRNEDRPGVIGKVGTLMGKHDINISRMSVALRPGTTTALAIVTVDSRVPRAALDEMASWEVMESVRQVAL